MIAPLVRSELIKLRTVRSTYYVLGALLALVALIVAATFAEAGEEGLRTGAELREPVLVAGGFIAAMVLAVFGATVTAGEYRHRTIGQRLLAAPGRRPVLYAKLLTYGALGGVVSAMTFGLALGIAEPFAAANDLALDLSGTDLALTLTAVVISGALFAMLGVITGLALRSQATCGVAILGLLLAENLFGGVIGDVKNYLPFALLDSLLGLDGTPKMLAAPALAGVTAGLAVVAAALLGRRDVT